MQVQCVKKKKKVINIPRGSAAKIKMEAPTLDIADGACEDTEDTDEVDSGPEPWGWLFPQTKACVPQGKLVEASCILSHCDLSDQIW